MSSPFFDVGGEPIEPEELCVQKSRDLALKLRAGRIDFASFVVCRKDADAEWVVFDVDVEVSQVPLHPIRASERIAARFDAQDATFPIVYALRRDFPRVPHLNLHIEEYPRSLCLYDERYEDIKRTWTAPRFVHRVREWLALNARGELHQGDQPLEPLLGEHAGHIVLPRSAWDATDAPQRLFVTCRDARQRLFLIAKTEPPSDGAALDMLASVHRTPPHTHGVIHRRPRSLADLASILAGTGLDLLEEVRERIKEWHATTPAILGARLLLVIVVPMRREDEGEPERVETWAFYLGDATANHGASADLRIRYLGQRIGLWDVFEGEVAGLLQPDAEKRGDDVAVDVLNVSSDLTRSMAAFLNGDDAPAKLRVAAVGAGALGSQAILHLARSGFGQWTLVDHDQLMPHNAARHALDGHFIGCNKAEGLAFVANSIVGENLFLALPRDVLCAGEGSEDLARVMREADTILDVSTSVAVARTLACDVDSNARRASLFMTPSGKDLVLIAEDQDRRFPLDALEMQYYRAAIDEPALEGHFGEKQSRRRYGQSCRDITSTLPQHMVALHAAIAAGALRERLRDSGPLIAVWRAELDGSVRRIAASTRPVIRLQAGGWEVVTDEGLLDRLSALREQKLPNETGGVLLGSFDVERSILYIADALPSPPDSEEWPTLYIRGSKGLRDAVDNVQQTTHGMIEYVGEWHSHPRGACTAASHDDLEVFAWLTSLMEADGLPAVMMIVGDPGRTSCYVGEIKSEENLLQGVSS
ncbi:MAG: hypothetical protein A2284_18900 [Deltaproteobacteria bacterium RIFOXYA12_FULL_61_11]|nr:MAG: hypothetical protein A2284_18900 [Deltaproteobacteria bacterium RIFOXYA12_FULL_61_11]